MTNEQIQALKEKAECICGILENIAGYEPGDIDGDDVELRFETEDGFDTGCNVSIVEQCQKSADVIRSLLAERDDDKALIATLTTERDEFRKRLKLERSILSDADSDLETLRQRIAELGGHLRNAHAFIENTEAFGGEAATGIISCGGAEWNIDASKAALVSVEN